MNQPSMIDVVQKVVKADQLQVQFMDLAVKAIRRGVEPEEVAKIMDETIARGRESIAQNMELLVMLTTDKWTGGRGI